MRSIEELAELIDKKDAREMVDGCSFLQSDFPLLNDSKILLTEAIVFAIMEKFVKTDLSKKEYGMFLFGHKINDNLFYFDEVGKNDFKSMDREVNVGDSCVLEMYSYLKKGYDAVIHFHTHPNLDIYDSRNFSDQDLFLYGVLQTRFQMENNFISYIGLLGSIYGGSMELNFVYYDSSVKKIYRINDIYYQHNNNIIKINSINDIPTINAKTLKEASKEEKELLMRKIN